MVLVLDDKYVVPEPIISEKKLTLPADFIWCLTHMTTSGIHNVGAHCRDLRFAMHGTSLRHYLGNATAKGILSPSEELTARMRIEADMKISWRHERLFLELI